MIALSRLSVESGKTCSTAPQICLASDLLTIEKIGEFCEFWATDVIDDKVNGFLVDPKNHAVYASKINILLSNASLSQQFGVLAREKVIQKFSISVVAQQSLAFYKKLSNR